MFWGDSDLCSTFSVKLLLVQTAQRLTSFLLPYFQALTCHHSISVLSFLQVFFLINQNYLIWGFCSLQSAVCWLMLAIQHFTLFINKVTGIFFFQTLDCNDKCLSISVLTGLCQGVQFFLFNLSLRNKQDNTIQHYMQMLPDPPGTGGGAKTYITLAYVNKIEYHKKRNDLWVCNTLEYKYSTY